MPRSARSIGAISDPARRASESHKALRAVDHERSLLLAIRGDAVQHLRSDGWSWQQVATLLGIHRNRAAHLLDRRMSGRGPR
jgi:predicted XRE-type DNA-binding protein